MRDAMRLLTLLAVGATGGCYTYSPATPADITPDSRVRVTVSRERAIELEDVLRGATQTFVGTYMRADDGEMLFAVPLQGAQGGLSTRTVHNRISLPRADVVSLETRTFSKWRTAAVVAVGLTALGFGVEEAFSGKDEIEGDGRGEVDSTIIPLISIPFH